MQGNNRNFILAIVLSIAVLIGWQVLVISPQAERNRLAEQQLQEQQAQQQANAPAQPAADGAAPAPDAAVPTPAPDRDTAIGQTARVPIRTGAVTGSINLTGGRIDDLRLNDYRETTDPDSPTIVLLSPNTGPNGYFADTSWTAAAGVAVPGNATVWSAPAGAALTPTTPVTLTFDNGAGLVFRKTIAIDDRYMFTVTDTVENTGAQAVTLTPYGRILRSGEPQVAGYFILHEGFIGVLGDEGLEEVTYKSLVEDNGQPGAKTYAASNSGWLGMTDKYWATAMVPPSGQPFTSSFQRLPQGGLRYMASYQGAAVSVAPGAKSESVSHLFAGAKQVAVVDGYEKAYGIDRFELLIDWGWFYFLTKPMFHALDWIFHLVGNFGVAILIVTVIVKLIFFPLANRSYRSMSAMRKIQPEMLALRERYKDDRVKQQQQLMELYRREKINPVAGCWPMLLQIPVFFSLYKVLFVTLEMRHAPFFGWIKDLSAPDPTSLFNLFGLLPYTPPSFLHIGAWPIIMGITMWVQMRLTPTQPDRTQQLIFNWMPVVFTFFLAAFPAGLVIYWAWNNTLSVIQQSIIMKRSGVPVDLFGNIRSSFRRPPRPAAAPAAAGGEVAAAKREPAAPVPAKPAAAKGTGKRTGKPAKGEAKG